MPFSFADDIGSISAKRLLKKYKQLRVLGNSFIHHTTEANGEIYRFVMFRGNFVNTFALKLYDSIVHKYPLVTESIRKDVSKELDAAIKLAEENLPVDK